MFRSVTTRLSGADHPDRRYLGRVDPIDRTVHFHFALGHDHAWTKNSSLGCQIAPNCDPLFASKNDPSDGAETGGAEPQIAEQSRSWRAAIGEREVMRGS